MGFEKGQGAIQRGGNADNRSAAKRLPPYSSVAKDGIVGAPLARAALSLPALALRSTRIAALANSGADPRLPLRSSNPARRR